MSFASCQSYYITLISGQAPGNLHPAQIKKVPASSYIVIEYSDFKKNVDAGVYTSVAKIVPGIMNRTDLQVNIQKSKVSPEDEVKNFCPYCGAALSVADAKFCSSCGHAI